MRITYYYKNKKNNLEQSKETPDSKQQDNDNISDITCIVFLILTFLLLPIALILKLFI